MKYIAVACITLARVGCAVTGDVTTKLNLSEGDRRAVENIRTKANSRCVIVTTNPRDVTPTPSGRTAFTSKATITRLYLARENWYKAEFRNQGVIGNVYYDPGTDRLICSQQEWDRFSNTAGMQFHEVGTPTKPRL